MALREIFYKQENINISYKTINNKAQKNMIFLHGWGSNKELMEMSFMNNFKDFNHIYIDLPGFGGSSTEFFLDTYDYAKIIEIFLKEISINNETHQDIVVGHSFGGKIALLLHYDIILLSSAGILLPKPFSVRCKILFSKILKYSKINQNFLRAKDAHNLTPIMYEIFKCVVNEDFSQVYANFKYKATIFWGRQDSATPLVAYEKICTFLPTAHKHILDGDHYFFLKQADKIEQLYYEDIKK
ncbi:alpha/beta hydrolase [Helicobacter didelphidarum]|uniref:Alpha/beta hydrolase n=1 Tax=Helicobacter didelphidarum TaxID=2040648 RepID=A0A3D8IPP6_9HELI|nr:alpha/beta hydrolase [Helicobacter didelphidarum]RDU67073.1 alpha/beta hydrolase [Helicobacter didelphidarum]